MFQALGVTSGGGAPQERFGWRGSSGKIRVAGPLRKDLGGGDPHERFGWRGPSGKIWVAGPLRKDLGGGAPQERFDSRSRTVKPSDLIHSPVVL